MLERYRAAGRCVVEDDRVKFNDSTRVPQTDEPMYQLIDEWMARDRRRREEQQAPIIRIEHEEDPLTNANMFVAAHNAFQYIEKARIEEYVSEGEDTAEEVISETEYEARWAGTEQALAAARREENKQQRKTPKFDGVAVPGKERRTATSTAEQPGPSRSGSTDAPKASPKDKGKQPDRSAGGSQGPTSVPKTQLHVTEDQDAGKRGHSTWTSLLRFQEGIYSL
ncbi:hypothetical protein M404DRAFT_36889 [Pisolithus tinctorius Marx 270]|uniref:Uncharacterized protein n=1 Tax=Pisolithus tinctorius Marx 270 TaxID=870435 RepID=A0A0C3I600_PISTI|nr:hypothetical protein M404DRAFT_36889 [Pisolithus tinctorius Marx 270]